MTISKRVFSEQSKLLLNYNNRATKFCKKFNYSRSDFRTKFFNNLCQIAVHGQMMLNLLDSLTIADQNNLRIITAYLGIKDADQDVLEKTASYLELNNKISLVVRTHFQIEYCLFIISKKLKIGKSKKFYNLAKSVINNLKLEPFYVDVLYTLALIRNSLHNNGIHYGYKHNRDITKTIKGVEFNFIHGEVVNCAFLEQIVHLLNSNLDVFVGIFEHPDISALEDPVDDIQILVSSFD